MLRSLLIAALAAGCASPQRPCALPAITPDPRPPLWEVRGDRGAIVLYGTHQLGTEEDVPDLAWRYLAQAEVFVSEAEEPMKGETWGESAQVRHALELPDGQSLMKMLADDDYMELRSRLGLGNRTLARMRPWVALAQLVKTVFVFPEPSLPSTVYDRAEAAGIAMEHLDTWMHQTVFLDMTVGADDLTGAIRDADLACALKREQAAYRSWSAAAFVKRPRSMAPGVIDNEGAAIATRGQVWTDKLATYVDGGRRAFVAIGISNLVGPSGILERLAQRGYTVTRL